MTTVLIPPYDPEGTTVSIQAWDLPAGPQSVDASSYTSSSIEIDAGYHTTVLFPAGVLVSAFANAPYKIWDVLEGANELYPISCCSSEIGINLYISSRHELRAAIGDSRTGTVMIWDLVTGEPRRTIQVAEPNEFQQVYLSPDGERLVILNFDTSIETWDVTTGQKLLTLPGPATVATASNLLWFSPYGKLLAVNAGNRGLKILNFEIGQELLTLPGSFDVEFTPDGTRVIMATQDERGRQIVRTYLLHLEDIVALAKSRVTRSLTTEECQKYLHMAQCPSP